MDRNRALADVDKAFRAVVGVAVTVIIVGVSVIGIRAGYDFYADEYRVSGVFGRAGGNLKENDDVKLRGVKIGVVHRIQLLPDHRVRITMEIDDRYQVPADAQVRVASQNVFGKREMQILETNGTEPPYLTEGSEFADTGVGTTIAEIVETGVPLFEGIDTTELATLMTEFVEIADGEGETFARNLDTGLELSRLLEDTIGQQLEGLDTFAEFVDTYQDVGTDFNAIVDNLDLALPVLNENRAAFERLLDNAEPVARNLADLLAQVRPDLDVILGQGANLNRLLIASEPNVRTLITGLEDFFSGFNTAFGPGEEIPGAPETNNRFPYIKALVYVSDINQLLCGVLFQATFGAQGALDPVLDALDGTFLDCGEYAARPGELAPRDDPEVPQPPTDPSGGPAGSAETNSAPGQMDAPPGTEAFVNEAYSAVGRPEGPATTDLTTLLGPLLGGGG